MLGAKLSEYHTGYRAYSRTLLEKTRWAENSNDFVFDNEMLAQIILGQFQLGEISVPTKYFDDASSIGFARSVRYGLGVLRVSLAGAMHRTHLWVRPNFSPKLDA
jgi:hypothetical protein